MPILVGTTSWTDKMLIDCGRFEGAASAAQRFVYDYPDAELQELLPRIERLSRTVGATHVIFNNCFEDQGQRNGLSLMRMAQSALT